jgi:hypothetical protein
MAAVGELVARDLVAYATGRRTVVQHKQRYSVNYLDNGMSHHEQGILDFSFAIFTTKCVGRWIGLMLR